jgi:sodium-type flagellar protein MotY
MMINIRLHTVTGWLFGMLAALLTLPSYAITYYAGLESSEWHVQSSVLECRIWQPIPNFGEGVFSNRAGYGLQFHLRGASSALAPGEAKISAESPSWKPNGDTHDITDVWVVDDLIPLTVKAPYADLMMAKLTEGLMPTISTQSDLAAGYPEAKVVVSAVNFQHAFADYAQCVRNLLPVNYRQIERSTIFYASGRTKLAPEVLEQLDVIIRYVKADKRIKRVVIDGHTDAAGDKKVNVRVSKHRADLVMAYFKKAGISSKKMVARWHGDRYPSQLNDTDEGRARNRRVTIRLDRE